MKNLFFDTKILDSRATQDFLLPSEILMENAARGMAEFICSQFDKHSKILLVCGSGDNGADCLALARMLAGKYSLGIFLPLGIKSSLCQLQYERLKKVSLCCEIEFLSTLDNSTLAQFNLIIDGIFGIGFKGQLADELKSLIALLNQSCATKIACDIPSGIDKSGNSCILDDKAFAFKADFTLTMGALKTALFSDLAKDFVGEIHCIELGISQQIFSTDSSFRLLESQDFKAPKRKLQNCNKGSFGHLSIFGGEKSGASILAALSGFKIGAGLVSIISQTPPPNLPYEIMHSCFIPSNTTAILLGMGFGKETPLPLESLQNFKEIPLLLDADIFYHKDFQNLTQNFNNLILTPHPKEFQTILKTLCHQEISTQEIQKNRISLALEFSQKYPNITLILKGANSIIAKNGEIFINPLGSNALAKGGSGDVLAGMIGGFLAQSYSPLESCIQGTLAHSLCANNFCKKSADFSLSPLDLITQIRYL
ncbi:bifunctional ADP-dependent (S)-NAD(P)H-hydrate dehydratase/NAD(P)H-hydrate epimerase [Helicobacter pullorum]|uniref:bifunctional ADP-dependent NAD(P)H-hydrate dehydratase/NAD(P)H-hydrate epimerase n=1 Tax=Helicobacter pullorum TaxID=35818 RepID=UPI000816A0E7|nr:bifunctional ADP-dependent NAD(P)H-hydrate dehydratase/NAD(P)H-hydrate epimerase [Helicobacter pullorum]OCR04800.1 bifunctional ADP-dependent (S)-NAD(P)H-hydrate dehydratase/NAD(P)H-hydrate epimerase [Helicobacter pullorum]OCR07574.1 bifunctional ADP-dependent (S)-NAD(P)H-hydrate dehydratase/NAD(P)H-hydrate epimerase [Helicobacter pullorum]OCR09112.1 bifunctional ADP-dependent (S)-NAD(P)H-hydrate dehydratase/NAD(P)H-hydrate epimerase [Helicobacter pullorum]OCR13536.1 bifunctional ADP-depende